MHRLCTHAGPPHPHPTHTSTCNPPMRNPVPEQPFRLEKSTHTNAFTHPQFHMHSQPFCAPPPGHPAARAAVSGCRPPYTPPCLPSPHRTLIPPSLSPAGLPPARGAVSGLRPFCTYPCTYTPLQACIHTRAVPPLSCRTSPFPRSCSGCRRCLYAHPCLPSPHPTHTVPPSHTYIQDFPLPEELFRLDFVVMEDNSGAVDNNGWVSVGGDVGVCEGVGGSITGE